MSFYLRSALEKRKQYLIEQLVSSHVYKKSSKHLFEWTLSDVEQKYLSVQRDKKHEEKGRN